MSLGLNWDRQHLDLELDSAQLLTPRRSEPAAALADPVAAMRDALEQPLDYPALRRSLTPDDHVAIVVDEAVPQLGKLLVPILEHIQKAGVSEEHVTIVCAPPSSGQSWVDDLPDEFQDVRIEVHQPDDRKKLSYLATTKAGRRVYLNRTVVDADQIVILSRRWYDPVFGVGGAEGTLFPELSDKATRDEFRFELSDAAPDEEPWPIREEAQEIAWLLGAPFLVQIIEGDAETLTNIVGGPIESSAEGQRLLNARWKLELDTPADVVVATLLGDPSQHRCDDLARAFLAASRVVRPGGAIVLLTDAAPELQAGFERMRQFDDPGAALLAVQEERPNDLVASFEWLTAAQQAKLYLLSGLAEDVVEELFAIPLKHVHEVRRLLQDGARCLYLPDANKALAVLS